MVGCVFLDRTRGVYANFSGCGIVVLDAAEMFERCTTSNNGSLGDTMGARVEVASTMCLSS